MTTTSSIIRLRMDRSGIQVDAPDWVKRRVRSLSWDARQCKVEFFITGDDVDKPAQQNLQYWQIWDARLIPEEIRDEVNPETHPENPGILVKEVNSFAEANGFLVAIAYLMPEEQAKGAFYWYGPLERTPEVHAGSARVYQEPLPPPGAAHGRPAPIRPMQAPLDMLSSKPVVFHRDNLADRGLDPDDTDNLRGMGIAAGVDEGADRPGDGDSEGPEAPVPDPGGSQ